ncbi:MAG: response regulator [Gammaproteobacteria bacterium]|nr:response regulator [Gammaproteobacteria bacterium]MCH9744393.1 response regulator [Gammaproteobacteria bacterium]
MESLISKFLVFLAERSPDVFWIRSADYSKQIYINPAFTTVWQRDVQEMYDHPERWSDFLYPEDKIKLQESIEKRNPTVRPGDSFLEEYRIVRPSGEIRYIRDYSFPIFDKAEHHIGFAGIAIDITPERIYTKELEQAKLDAEQASRAKSEFIANISHDIRTPITGILGLAHSLENNAVNEQNRQDAGLLIAATQELLGLLNEVIELSKLDGGHNDAAQEVFLIQGLAEHNINLFKAATKHKNIALNLVIDKNVPEAFLGNRIYLDRILLNLIGNAVKFTNEGEITLSIKVARVQSNIAKVVFSLKDTGIGIPADQFNNIFEQFNRLTPSYQGIYKGSGLGLSAVKKCLDAMNGTIKLESKLNVGSTFTVTVPLVISKQIFKKTNSNQEKMTAPSVKLTNPIATVLIVDDNTLAARMAAQVFYQWNCNSEFAADGSDALKLLKIKKFALVLLDIGLPDIDGFEVAKKIRQHTPAEDLPIIALTGHMGDNKKQQCLDAGMQDMLTKPVTLPLVNALIEKYIPTKNKEVFALLAASLPSDLKQLQMQCDNQQWEDMQTLVHKIYGGLCYCDTPELRDTAYQLKSALDAKQPDEIALQLNVFIEKASALTGVL